MFVGVTSARVVSVSRGAGFVVGLLVLAGCDHHADAHGVLSADVPSARVPASGQARPKKAAGVVGREAKSAPPPAPRVERTLRGNFRGRDRPGRVLFLDDSRVVLSWDENGKERREPVTTKIPPGTRQCKALRSLDSQDFLVCVYWITGPGGGRVDGELFDLARRKRGEFFSAAMNLHVLSTLCYPDTMLGPMPSFNVEKWSTRAATPDADAEVRVTVRREGWSTRQAASVRARPAMKKVCKCLGEHDTCAGAPKPPVKTTTIVYRLTHGRLHPVASSRKALGGIAGQWNHSASLKSWNLKMRGY